MIGGYGYYYNKRQQAKGKKKRTYKKTKINKTYF